MEKNTPTKIRDKAAFGFTLITAILVLVFSSSFDTIPAEYGFMTTYAETDTDNDGIKDLIDIDDDNDGIIDSIEDENPDGDNNPLTYPSDFDNDGVPNHLDVDSDNDGIIDNVEAQPTHGYIAPSGIDSDGNGLDDNYEETPGSCGGLVPIDSDLDSYPDYLDIDSDNDGILDNIEAQTTADFQAPCGMDSDGNGLDDHYEESPGSCGGLLPVNTDGDSQPDYRDIDSDNDGILDNVEAQEAASFQPPCGMDSDGNGLDDHYENTPGSGEGLHPINSDNDPNPNFRDIDSDNDGIPDNVEAQTTSGYIAPSGYDADKDGLDDIYEGSGDQGLTPVNTDGTDEQDYLDADTDNDLIADNNEGNDFNFDGIPDQTFTGTDTDSDGLDNGYEGSDVNDGFDVNDEIDDPANDLPDTDGEDDVNYRDIDDDGDGMDTPDEDSDDDGDPTNDDADGDDTPDYLDPDTSDDDSDADGDGVLDVDELSDGTDPSDPCDYMPSNQAGTLTTDWNNLDCDGDGVTNGDEVSDSTDPLDSCDLILASQTMTPTTDWNNLDCDGDGVTNGDEVSDSTDPLDPCDFNQDSVTLTPSGDYLVADCDGDGVTNGDETTDGTDPLDSCDLILANQTVTPTIDWGNLDCDGDGVTNGDEVSDSTDPLDSCDFILASQTVTPTTDWISLDCDGDGVTNGDEVSDSTDPLDPCDFNQDSVTLTPSGDYLAADCDGDGVTNGDEATDGTDPLDSCDLILASQTVTPTVEWNNLDCDGDGVTNGDEVADATDPLDSCDLILTSQTVTPTDDWDNLDCDGDGVTNGDEVIDSTDPLDPCDLLLASQTVTPSEEWNLLDCDSDGNSNGTDPNPLIATAVDDSGTTLPLTEVVINILANDDYLPNNDPNNLGTTSITRIGGDATGIVSFDPETGELFYTPSVSENNINITIIYEVCNTDPDPDVCASATVTIFVSDNPIDAVDDDFSELLADGTTGGVIEGGDIFDNDTLNGTALDPADVTLTSTPTGPLTINADGTVSVAPDTAPGTYTIDYTICEIANPINCDTATVTVEVINVTIDAVDDDYSDIFIDGEDGGVLPDSNVLDNDTLNGLSVDPDDVTITSTPTGPLTVNTDGTISVAPDTPTASYSIEYTICENENPTNCDTATVVVLVSETISGAIEVNQLVTPNNDGRNDFLFINGVENALNNSLKIFNRWGVAVYEGRNYNNQNNVFDGRSRGRSTISTEDYLPSGVYFYIFEYQKDQENISKSGYLYISK